MNVVIRYSSFGDIVLTAAVTGALAPVRFVTLARYRELAAALPGVEEVAVHEDHPRIEGDRIIDLHASLRSRLSAPRAARVRRYDVKRRLRVALKTSPAPSVVSRYAEAAGVEVAPQPWIALDRKPQALLLCPGTAHANKAWPPSAFIEVGRRYEGDVIVLGGPGETALTRQIADGIGPHATAVADAPLSDTLAAVAAARIAVAGDTGLLHLCGAANVPVIGLFGPTHADDGFWCHRGVPLGVELACRPCSRYGGPRCPIGDHRCLRALSPDIVLQHILDLENA